MRKVCIALLGALVLICGCSTVPKREREMSQAPLLEPKVLAKFSDIPVPVGFTFEPRESYAFESAGVRAAVLKYSGRAQAEQVINFYKEQMPMYNWRLLNIVEYGERLLNFDSDSETCIIRMVPQASKIALIVNLAPKPQSARKPDKPLK